MAVLIEGEAPAVLSDPGMVIAAGVEMLTVGMVGEPEALSDPGMLIMAGDPGMLIVAGEDAEEEEDTALCRGGGGSAWKVEWPGMFASEA